MRLIFRPPVEFLALVQQPLAYVEWFTAFQVRDSILGFYSIARSTSQERYRASVVSIKFILWTCHLIPVWGKRIDHTWSPANVLERCTRFYVNPYLRHSDFILFRLLLDRWLREKERQRRVR